MKGVGGIVKRQRGIICPKRSQQGLDIGDKRDLSVSEVDQTRLNWIPGRK